MGTKVVVNPDGSQSVVPTTPADDAQAAIDAAAWQSSAQAAQAEVARVAAIRANARRQALLTAIMSTDDAGIITYITNNVTDLPSARAMLINLALLVAAQIRN